MGPRIFTLWATTISSALREFAVTSLLGSKVHNHRSGRHFRPTVSLNIRFRGRLTRNQRGCNDPNCRRQPHALCMASFDAVCLLASESSFSIAAVVSAFWSSSARGMSTNLAPRLSTCSLHSRSDVEGFNHSPSLRAVAMAWIRPHRHPQ